MPTKPSLIGTSPYFAVADLERAARHYEAILGFRREYSEGRPARFVILRRDGVAVMLRRAANRVSASSTARQDGTWDAFFWASDVQRLYEEFRANGADVVYGPTVQHEYHMKEFAVRDADGYVLGFGQQWH